MTPIPRAERLIVALDVATPNEAKALVERLGDAARFYKVGLELFMAGGYFELLEWLVRRGNKVFVDLKFSCDVERLVLSRARRALQAGCDGVISSGLEAQKLKAEFKGKLLVITPGIRPVKNEDDQKRTVDVAQAFANGADYIVVGRPIRSAADPRAAAQAIQRGIAAIFP